MTVFGASGDRPGRRKYFGKYPGIVVDNASGGGAHLGKIKVRVPAILEEDESGAPRPAEIVARPCLPPGFFFVPEIDDHVWIEFAAGEIDEPIWVGVWYPEDAPPETASGDAPTEKQKVIRTASGHVVTLDDDAESVVVTDKHGNTLTLESDRVLLEQGDATVELRGGHATITGASITLGDEDSAKGLLMDVSPLVLQFFMSHQHVGNLGSPTGPPTPSGDASWFTSKTKAE